MIDVRNKHFVPVLFPTVFLETGKVFFSAKTVDKTILSHDGMVQYGRLNPKVVAKNIYGKDVRPIVIKGSVKKQSNIVLKTKDLNNILSKISSEMLKQGKVIIIF